MGVDSGAYIHPTAEVAEGAIIGRGTKVWHQAQIREGVKIGVGCNIGKGVYIDKDVSIGDGVKIQNGVSIYQGVELEDDVFVGPYVSFTNDIRPRSFLKEWEVIPTKLRKGCSIGANATILCGITLGEYSMIAAGTVVTDDTLPYGLYIGHPARLKGFVGKSGHELTLQEAEPGALLYKCRKTGETLSIRFDGQPGPS